jgi:hypothetical protein
MSHLFLAGVYSTYFGSEGRNTNLSLSWHKLMVHRCFCVIFLSSLQSTFNKIAIGCELSSTDQNVLQLKCTTVNVVIAWQ